MPTAYTVNIYETSAVGGYTANGYTTSGYVTSTGGLVIGETLERSQGFSRTITPSVTLADSSARTYGALRSLTQTLLSIVLITRACAFFREITQGAGGYTASGYTASGYVTDTLTLITDNVSRLRDVPRSLSEILTASENLARTYGALRTISQSVTVPAITSRVYGALRTLTQTVTASGSVARAIAAIRTITASVHISEILVGILGIPGVGISQIREASTRILKRTGITALLKRRADTKAVE